MLPYTLGSLDASEALIRDLYIDLRTKVNQWSEITKQTPQARMGYVGQHLVSIVTGFPGGKSGARGYDLVMGEHDYGEIKTCYRVDQLGACRHCGAVVSSLETSCSACGSLEINRKDDSKWLISLRNDKEFEEVIEPRAYYFVLFEFEDLRNAANNDIVASIWEVDPKTKGFAYCMTDYYLNIRAHSKSKAPFNMWPHEFKFLLTKPTLIYRSIIHSNGTISTLIFPTKNNARKELLKPLTQYSRATTITEKAARGVLNVFSLDNSSCAGKADCLQLLEQARTDLPLSNDTLCDAFCDTIYLPHILSHKDSIPISIRKHFPDLI